MALPDLELLEGVRFNSGQKVLNTGPGTACRTMELAQRLGPTSVVYGLLSEKKNFYTIPKKCTLHGWDNIELFQGKPDQLPFADSYFDLILYVCNYSGMQQLGGALSEAARVAKSSAQFLLSVPLKDTLKEYHTMMEDLLRANHMFKEAETFQEVKRLRQKPLKEVEAELKNTGLCISEITLRQYSISFLDGTAFLNHWMVKEELIPDWDLFLNGTGRETFSRLVENRLNEISGQQRALVFNMPFAVLDCSLNNQKDR